MLDWYRRLVSVRVARVWRGEPVGGGLMLMEDAAEAVVNRQHAWSAEALRLFIASVHRAHAEHGGYEWIARVAHRRAVYCVVSDSKLGCWLLYRRIYRMLVCGGCDYGTRGDVLRWRLGAGGRCELDVFSHDQAMLVNYDRWRFVHVDGKYTLRCVECVEYLPLPD